MKNLRNQTEIAAVILAAILPLEAFGQDLMVYPARGQTPDQVSQDRYGRHTWAAQQSGFDPSAGASAPQPGNQPRGIGREALRGGARGAAAGAAIGTIAGDAGTGAAIGATAWGLKRAFGKIDANKGGAPAAANSATDAYTVPWAFA